MSEQPFASSQSIGLADRGASGFFVVRQPHSWFWVSGHEGRPIWPNSCSTMLCPVSKVAFWPKLFTIHRFRRLIWHSAASQVAQQSAETVPGWFGGHANKVDIWSYLSFFQLEGNVFSTNVSVSLHCLNMLCRPETSKRVCFATVIYRWYPSCSFLSLKCSDILRGW